MTSQDSLSFLTAWLKNLPFKSNFREEKATHLHTWARMEEWWCFSKNSEKHFSNPGVLREKVKPIYRWYSVGLGGLTKRAKTCPKDREIYARTKKVNSNNKVSLASWCPWQLRISVHTCVCARARGGDTWVVKSVKI